MNFYASFFFLVRPNPAAHYDLTWLALCKRMDLNRAKTRPFIVPHAIPERKCTHVTAKT